MSSSLDIFEQISKEGKPTEDIFSKFSGETSAQQRRRRTIEERQEAYEATFPEETKSKFIGFIEGLGRTAQTLSGGLPTPEQVIQQQFGVEGETPQQRVAREKRADIGEFLSTLALPFPKFGAVKKGLTPNPSQENVVNFLKQFGFTEKEITPLIQGEGKLGFLGKLAKKDKKTAKLIDNIYQRFGGVYDNIITRGSQSKGLNPNQWDNLSSSLYDQLKKLPNKFRRLIEPDVREFLQSETNFADHVNLWQDINKVLGQYKGSKSMIGILKGPLFESMAELSPTLNKDFQLANKLYSKGKQISKQLLPKNFDEFVEAGELFGLAAGLAKGNFGILQKVLGLAGARRLAREFLINPKLQNIGRKVLNNISRGNKKEVVKLMDQSSNILKKKDASLAKQIKDLEP